MSETRWHHVPLPELASGDVTTVVVANRALALTRVDDAWSLLRPIWETSLVNPDFAEYARSCGGTGFRVSSRDQLRPKLEEAMAIQTGPSLVVIESMAHAI